LTSKRFTLITLALTIALSTGFVLFNIFMDEFGIHSNTKPGDIKIWTYNRASKYLMSLNYIPSNFKAILIGSSSSAAMVDTKGISSVPTYNLSLNGANICEMAPAAIETLERGNMRYLFICLDPYLTKNSHMKTNELSPELLSSSYGSLFNIKFYLYKSLYTLFPEKNPYRNSGWGYRLAGENEKPITQAQADAYAAKIAKGSQPFAIDPQAVRCLKEIIMTARTEGTRIVAYFHPKPEVIFQAARSQYLEYQKEMKALLSPEDILVDLNDPAYDELTGDISNFHDTTHLSASGGRSIVKILNQIVSQ